MGQIFLRMYAELLPPVKGGETSLSIMHTKQRNELQWHDAVEWYTTHQRLAGGAENILTYTQQPALSYFLPRLNGELQSYVCRLHGKGVVHAS